MARLVVVSGTGTEIGKTHFATALVLAWGRRGYAVAGLKPVESGVPAGSWGADGAALEQASTFHVKRCRPPYLLERAVSPHLAARDEGLEIRPEVIQAYVAPFQGDADAVVVELAGGLFSPLARNLTNADVAALLQPDAHLLVAPDRLGVLHDVTAAVRAARATTPRAAPTGIVLVTPAAPDLSTGTNAAELAEVTDVPVLGTLPRTAVEELARSAAVARILDRL